jgi:transcriptional regulator with XRE-family HTH domain
MPRRRDSELLVALGARLREVRNARGFTQERLAEAIGVRTATISRFENGLVGFSISTLADLADALDCPMSALVDLDQSPKTAPIALSDPAILRLLALPDPVRTRVAALAVAMVEGAVLVPSVRALLGLDAPR